MLTIPVHHIHVKNGKEIYTLCHHGGCISLKSLESFIKDIKNKD